MNEFEQKQKRILDFLAAQGLDGLLINQVSNFAWATCGAASYVNTAVERGEAWLLITPEGRYLFTSNIEATRMRGEEKLEEQGWQFVVHPWYEGPSKLAGMVAGLKVGADVPYPGAVDIAGQLVQLRTQLLPEEAARFREVGNLCAEAMDRTIGFIKPGQTEYDIAAHLAFESQRRGVQAIVNLIAVDDNIYSYRHPLPTARELDRYAMVVLCGRRYGLVASITRLIHFGPIPDELKAKAEAVARVDATFIAKTRPGASLGDIFASAQQAYAETGYPDEWQLHHQGGPASYDARDFVATPGSTETVVLNQAFAWNPSITGTKSEDTILVGDHGNDIITAIDGWPTLSIEIDGQVIERPAILEVK